MSGRTSLKVAGGIAVAATFLLGWTWQLGWLTLREWQGGSDAALGYATLSGVWALIGLAVAHLLLSAAVLASMKAPRRARG